MQVPWSDRVCSEAHEDRQQKPPHQWASPCCHRAQVWPSNDLPLDLCSQRCWGCPQSPSNRTETGETGLTFQSGRLQWAPRKGPVPWGCLKYSPHPETFGIIPEYNQEMVKLNP